MTGNKVLNIIRQKSRYILPQDANLLLYGSRARGSAGPDSDWDFIILLNSDNISDNDYSKYAYPLQEIGFDMGYFFSTHIYSNKQWNNMAFTPFYKNVQRDKIQIL